MKSFERCILSLIQACGPRISILLATFLLAACSASQPPGKLCKAPDGLCIDNLATLSVEQLRARHYGSKPRLIKQLSNSQKPTPYSRHYSEDGSSPYKTYIAGYQSEGLALFARLDIPASPLPAEGYPLVIFTHGWMGIEAAPDWDFAYRPGDAYADIIDYFVDAGFAVLTPGYRGHGRVDGKSAEGLASMKAWDNGSYLSPIFYSIDVLNLLEGLDHLNQLKASDWDLPNSKAPKLNLDAINVLGHSQGGDVALNLSAISGEGSTLKHPIQHTSIWSGNIPSRDIQIRTFGPMAKTTEAFMSGDGTWTGSAKATDGRINPNFIFAWPSDWIATLDQASPTWSWQAQQWSEPSVLSVLKSKYSELYDTLNLRVKTIENAQFTLSLDKQGKIQVEQDADIFASLQAIGGFNAERYLSETLSFHISDRDYYSIPAWNIDLARRINNTAGKAHVFIYEGNTHGLQVSEHRWFSPAGTVAGKTYALERDLRLFRGENPEAVLYP